MNINDAKMKYNLSQKELSQILKVTRTKIIEYELNNHLLNEIQIAKIENHIKIHRTNKNISIFNKVDKLLEYYPDDCKVNQQNAFTISRVILGKRLNYIRMQRNASAEEFTELLRLPNVTRYLNYEKGRNRFYPSFVNLICEKLNVDPLIFDEKVISEQQRQIIKLK